MRKIIVILLLLVGCEPLPPNCATCRIVSANVTHYWGKDHTVIYVDRTYPDCDNPPLETYRTWDNGWTRITCTYSSIGEK